MSKKTQKVVVFGLVILCGVSLTITVWPKKRPMFAIPDSRERFAATEQPKAAVDELGQRSPELAPRKLDWELIRNDAAWTYENWDMMSWQMFKARSQDQDFVKLLAKYDKDGDGIVDPEHITAYDQEKADIRNRKENGVVDFICKRYDTNADGILDTNELSGIRQVFAHYLKTKRNTPENAWAFTVLGRKHFDANGDRNFDSAEQMVLTRLEELAIWPPGNPSLYDVDTFKFKPTESVKLEQLIVTRVQKTKRNDEPR